MPFSTWSYVNNGRSMCLESIRNNLKWNNYEEIWSDTGKGNKPGGPCSNIPFTCLSPKNQYFAIHTLKLYTIHYILFDFDNLTKYSSANDNELALVERILVVKPMRCSTQIRQPTKKETFYHMWATKTT